MTDLRDFYILRYNGSIFSLYQDEITVRACDAGSPTTIRRRYFALQLSREYSARINRIPDDMTSVRTTNGTSKWLSYLNMRQSRWPSDHHLVSITCTSYQPAFALA